MKSKHWSLFRAIIQLAFWLIFVGSIVYLHDPLSDVRYGLYPSLSIYSIFIGSITGHTLKYAFLGIAIALLTVLFGRFFCGWICPLGATIDASDTVIETKAKNKQLKKITRIKILILLATLLIAFLGFNATGYSDPITIAYRGYELFLYPFISYLGSEPLSWVLPGYAARDYPFYYYNWIWPAIIFIGILALSLFFKRFWCRVLCPLGAIYALLSHFSLLRRTVDADKCVHCGACVKGCRMGALSSDGTGTIEHECIKCFDCLKHCNYGAIQFRFLPPYKSKSIAHPAQGITRKDLLVVAGSSLMIASTRLTLFAASHESYIIRPPGALPESDFCNACIRCGQCMNVCPTNALHPCMIEAGFYGMFTPRLVSRIGYCDFSCTRCGTICPTGAIQKLSLAKKQTFVIGTAYIIKDLCIPWSESTNCIVCEEVCPVQNKAITLDRKVITNKKGEAVEVLLPVVHTELCIGCGICENRCPVSGGGAIMVRKPKLTMGDSYG